MEIRSAGFNDWTGQNGVSQYTGRTNLIMNPSFETNDLYVGLGGSTSAKVQDSTEHNNGSFSLKMTGATADDRVYYTLSDGFTAVDSQSYIFSAYLKGTGTIRLWVYDGSSDVYGSDITLSGTWTRFSLTFTAHGTSGLYAGFRQKNTESLTAYIDGVLLETGSTLNAYFDGSTAHCAWTGSANNSTSTQDFIAHCINQYIAFIDANYTIFQSGDIFECVPDEPEGNSMWNSTYGTIGSGAGLTAFNNFITDSIAAVEARLSAHSVTGVRTRFTFTFPSTTKDVINSTTATYLDALGTDDYPENGLTTPASMQTAMESEISTSINTAHSTKNKIITFGPSVYTQLSEVNQADALHREIDSIDRLVTNIYGITVWQFGATDNAPKSRLFDYTAGNWVARSATTLLNDYFSAAACNSPSASRSPSSSVSASVSPSASFSPSSSVSASISPSASLSASISPSPSISPSGVEYILSIDQARIVFPISYTERYDIKNTIYTDKYTVKSTSYIDKYSVKGSLYIRKYGPNNVEDHE